MIIFEIHNRREDYAICYSVMQFIADASSSFSYNDSVTVKLAETEIPDDNKKVPDVIKEAYNKKGRLPSKKISSSDELQSFLGRKSRGTSGTYCFFVFDCVDSDETDVINYHYFELIRKYNPSRCKCVLGVVPTGGDAKWREEPYYRISAFFHAESNSDAEGYNSRYCHYIDEKNMTNKFKHLAKKNSASKKFFPLLPTTVESYRILAQSTGDLFAVGESQSELFDVELRKAFLLSEKSLKSYKEPYDAYCQAVKLYLIKLYDDLTTGLNEKLKTEKSNVVFPVSRIEHMSVLATAYFLTFVHSIILPKGIKSTAVGSVKDTLNHDYCDKFEEMMFDAEDFSEGTLQLIENAIKHANGNGFLCFRTFNMEQAEKYFTRKLPFAFGGQYLNVVISDFNNEFDIPKKFVDNLTKYGVNEQLIADFKSANLTLSDFFDPSEQAQRCWSKYFENSENIALHYGLSVFDRVVSYAGGDFSSVSTENMCARENESYHTGENIKLPPIMPHIPGTQYNVLLPLTANTDSKPTGLNTTLNYSKYQEGFVRFIVIKKEDLDDNLVLIDKLCQYNPEAKESLVRELTGFLLEKANKEKECSLLIYADNIKNLLSCEILAKTLICFLGQAGNKSNTKRMAIVNASPLLRAIAIRIFGTLYYKRVNSEITKNTELYICGEFGRPEVEFVGNSIDASIAATETLASRRAEYSRDITLLRNVKKKSDMATETLPIDVFPFDMAVFKQLVVDDLNRDMQKHPFGCKLNNVHMRVGSKIHLTDCFFEATLLFGIENYVSRFAYLLVEIIHERILKDDYGKGLVLVGYETYSELLLLEIKDTLRALYGIDCEYIIYDDSADEKFRDYGKTSDTDINNTNFVIVVPIGSTLTTHDKIVAHLERDAKYKGFQADVNVLTNLCVVLIRDQYEDETNITECEKDYWTSITKTYVTLENDYKVGSGNKVDYLVCVKGKWESPDGCSLCFPKDRLDEKPMLKVNKASVVPMTLLGLTEDKPMQQKNDEEEPQHEANVSLLRDSMYYGHSARGDNHFEYYPNTGMIITELLKEKNLSKLDVWLKELGKKINDKSVGNIPKYNFIVAPQHHTNAGFVVKVREKAFAESEGIIWLDVKREYRDNIKAKYSYLSQTFMNLAINEKEAEIHFHYVDDTIITGATFERAKDLLQSLFTADALSERGYKGIKVILFSSVTVLINRHSGDSLLKYAPQGRFFNYIRLHISNLRNHEDACVLCKKLDDYKKLCRMSATNSLAKEFQDRVSAYKQTDYNKPEDRFNRKEEMKRHNGKGFCRMLLTHELNVSLSKLNNEINNEGTVYDALQETVENGLERSWSDMFCNDNFDITEVLCSFLHVITSPFFSFRKSNLEAATKFLLNLAEYIIFPDSRKGYSKIFGYENLAAFIRKLEKAEDKSSLKRLLKYVFFRLSHLGVNYIIEDKVVEQFFKYTGEMFRQEEFTSIEFYNTVLKQVSVFHPFDDRSIRLEDMLNKWRKKKKHSDFVNFALIENNILICDALQEVTDTLNLEYKISNDTSTDAAMEALFIEGSIKDEEMMKKKVSDTLNYYFCDAYRRFVSKSKNKTMPKDEIVVNILNMAILKLLLIPDGNLSGEHGKYEYFYMIVLKYIAKILGARKVQLFLKKSIKDKPNTHYIGSSDSNDIWEEAGWSNWWKDGDAEIGETYYYKSNKTNRTAAIKIGHGTQDKKSVAWYLVFEVNRIEEFPNLLKARNLLVMRDSLLARLTKDYDNNLFDEFIDLKEKVKKLSGDNAGGHTAFPELAMDFEYLQGIIQSKDKNSNESEKDKEIIANQLKLITDELVSKLYVCSVVNSTDSPYPDKILNLKGYTDIWELENVRELLEYAKYLRIRHENHSVLVPDIEFEMSEEDFLTEFRFLKNHRYIWVCIYYALVLNALRHGEKSQISDSEYSVSIKVKLDEDRNSLNIENNVDRNENRNYKGITLYTINRFFDFLDYEFELPASDNDKSLGYSVKIPLKGHCNNA